MQFFCPDAEEYEKECGIPDGFTGNVCVENWKVTNYINGRIQYSMNFYASGMIYRVEIYGEDAGEKWYSFKGEYAERTDMLMRDRVYLRSEQRYGDCFIRYLPDGNIEHAGFGGYEYRYEYKHGKVVYESVFNRKNDYLLTIYYYNDGSIKRYYERNNGKIIDKEYYKNGSLAEIDDSKGYIIYYNENNAVSLIKYKWNNKVIDINTDTGECSLQHHFLSK